MEVKIGPYTFTHAYYYSEFDSLELRATPNGLAVIGFETDDGDNWFTETTDSIEFTGIEITRARGRYEEGITVELPTGKHVRPEGLAAAFTHTNFE